MACGSHADSCSITAQTKAGSSEWRGAASRAKPVNAEGISNTESYTAKPETPFASHPARQNGFALRTSSKDLAHITEITTSRIVIPRSAATKDLNHAAAPLSNTRKTSYGRPRLTVLAEILRFAQDVGQTG